MSSPRKYEAIEILYNSGICTLAQFLAASPETLNMYVKYQGEYWNKVKEKATFSCIKHKTTNII